MSQFITFMGDDLINALGWTFVHTLWQGCVIVLLMIFILQQIPARKAILRYTVATASMISMLVAAVATFAMLYFEPGKSEILSTQSAMYVSNDAGSTAFSFMSWLGSNLSAMVAIWIVGVVLLAFRLLFGLAYIQYLKQTASDLSFTLGGKLEAIAEKINYKRSLDVAESALVQIPVVVGHLKPLILFPVGAINQLSTEEVEAVLAHEIAHLVRNDFIQNLIQSVIEIVFYYHPAVWWISAVVRSERENCCDDLAIQVCGSSLAYARALVRLQEVGQTAPALALPFSGSQNHLLNRVKRILNEPQNKSNLMEKITATGLLLICLIFASFSDGKEETTREAIDVPALLVSNHFVHFDNAFVSDTIIPRSTQTIIHGDSDEKEVRLEIENGEISGLYINGEEVPESRYDEYAEEISALENSISNVPAPPSMPEMPPMPPMPVMPVIPEMAPMAPMPDMPDMPEMPLMPVMPPMPPMPPMPLMPEMPPMPDMPPMPELHGMHFEYHVDSSAPMVFGAAPTITRTETTIIREYDENGNASYRIEGDHSENTTIEIDHETGIAYIDGEELIIDADEITVIEEIETTPQAYSFHVAPEGSWNSDQWNFKFNKEFKEKWNSEEFQKQWKENWDQEGWNIQWNENWKENWNEEEWKAYWEENKDKWNDAAKKLKLELEDSKDGNSQMDSYQKALDGYDLKLKHYNKELEGHEGEMAVYLELVEKARKENADDAGQDLIIVRELVHRDDMDGNVGKAAIIELKREYVEAKLAAAEELKQHSNESRTKEMKDRERTVRELKERDARSGEMRKRELKEVKKDQSSIYDTENVRFFASTEGNSINADVIYVTTTDVINQEGMSWVADTMHYNSDSQLLTLTGNAELTVGQVMVTEGEVASFVVSPDGKDKTREIAIVVTGDRTDSSDKEVIVADEINYEVRVVTEANVVNGTKVNSKVRKQQ